MTNTTHPTEGKIPNFIKDDPSTLSNIRKYVASDEDMKNLVLRGHREKTPNYNAFENDIAIVNFYFDKSTIVQFNTFQRMTWFDYISQVGKEKQQFKVHFNILIANRFNILNTINKFNMIC